jgi:predicted nucleic acid-binding protein
MVMNSMLFDTCFLIDLEREKKKGVGAAMAFLKQHCAMIPLISAVTVGEFMEGFDDVESPACQAMLQHFQKVPSTEATARCYARITHKLRLIRNIMGANDLWIAATAIEHDVPLVTRNVQDFSRVAGLKLMGY